MPGKACLKLKGKARKDCLAYRGKYAKKVKGGVTNEMSRVRGGSY